MQCPQCQYDNSNTAKFCEECGSKLAQTCPSCGHEARASTKFCPECGTALTGQPSARSPVQPATQPSAQADQPSPERSIPDAERRQLTVMFCDLVGSTPLSEQLDPEDLRDVVRAYQQMCAEVVQHFDGHIAQLLGDALLVYFGWPQAHEDDAQRAVRTGLGMLEAMGILNTRLEQDKGIRLAIRVGIHTGLVVVGEMGGGGHQEQLALGDTPNVASRLQGLAEPDTIAISEATYWLVEGYFICQELGEQALKGVGQPMAVYRVLGESGAQMGATIGRQFSYSLLQSVSRLDAPTLHRELGRLVEAELLYQRGLPPEAIYTFKHALIQDVAYQSLLKSTRQQYHQQVAQVLCDRFPEITKSQPELLAHHYTEAGLSEQAIDAWQQAGELANIQSAYREAEAHLRKGLEVIQSQPETPQRDRRELTLQLALAESIAVTGGHSTAALEPIYLRAHALAQQVGETHLLLSVLQLMRRFYTIRGEPRAARNLCEELLALATTSDSTLPSTPPRPSM